MNIKQIRELAQIVHDNGLSALEISENDNHIRIERACQQQVAPAPVAAPVPIMEAPEPVIREESTVDFNRMREIKSPMVGVFYASPSPDAAPFVQVGSKVKKGDVVCIIEAMKLMNEITSECDGVIEKICVANGQMVEYGTELFRIRR